MSSKLTIKQGQFVKKLIETGNGTIAAMDTYDVKSSKVARVIASQNLTKLNVRQAIERSLEAKGLTPDFVMDQLKDAMMAGKGIKATNSDTLRAIDIYARITGAYESHPVQQTYESRLKKLSIKELTIELEKTKSNTTRLLEEFNP